MSAFILPTPTTEPPLTEVMLCAWAGSAQAGEFLAYHRGFLAIDTGPQSLLPDADRRELQRVASRAWRLADTDLVHLLQRRNGDCDFTYLIVARPRLQAKRGALRLVVPPRATIVPTA